MVVSYATTAHPQPGRTDLIVSGSSPLFLILNVYATDSRVPSTTVSTSCVVLLADISGLARTPGAAASSE